MSKSLDELFNRYGSDKGSNHHNYSEFYRKLMDSLEEEKVHMLILGIGGYHHTNQGGGDLKAFNEYSPNVYIDAVDLYDKSFLNVPDKRMTHIISQDDEKELHHLMNMNGYPNIIIDDASHICPLTIRSFEILFPFLEDGGTYIIEDVHSSYWHEPGADGTDFGGGDHPNTTINYFKYLIDRNLNRVESEGRIFNRGIVSERFDIESIQFREKMIIIKKK